MPSRPLSPRYALPGVLELSAVEQAQRIRDGTLTSRQLVETYLDRIVRLDPELNAFVVVMAEAARAEADRADRLREQGRLLGPFHGVPTAIKDHHLVRGTPTRIGTRALPSVRSPIDDAMVRRLRGAGFVLVGKTTMSELGLLPIVETDLQGPTRNPWDPTRTAGGSSGGAGAAVAAGLVPVAPGSDGAGSVRIPAALCGLFGHKPTRDLVPTGAGRVDQYGLVSIGPIARSIDDAAALLDVLAGPSGSHHVAGSRVRLPALRIGVVREPPFGELDARLVRAVDLAAARLREAGHHVEDRPCPAGTLASFLPIYQRQINGVPVLFPRRLQPLTAWFRAQGKAADPVDTRRRFDAFVQVGRDAMRGLDVMLTPSVGMLAPRVGQFAHLPPEQAFEALAPLGMFTALANLTGDPAISVPLGEANGLPLGIQLHGRRGHDDQLLALARLFETEPP